MRKIILFTSVLALVITSIMGAALFGPKQVAAAKPFDITYQLQNVTPELDFLTINNTQNPATFTVNNATHLWMKVTVQSSKGATVTSTDKDILRKAYENAGLILPITIDPSIEQNISGTTYTVSNYQANFAGPNQQAMIRVSPWDKQAYSLSQITAMIDLFGQFAGVDIKTLVFQFTAGHNPIGMALAIANIKDVSQFLADYSMFQQTGSSQAALATINDVIKIANSAKDNAAIKKLLILGLGVAARSTIIGVMATLLTLTINANDYVTWFFNYIKPYARFQLNQPHALIFKTAIPITPTPTPTTPTPTPTPPPTDQATATVDSILSTTTYNGSTAPPGDHYLVAIVTVTNSSTDPNGFLHAAGGDVCYTDTNNCFPSGGFPTPLPGNSATAGSVATVGDQECNQTFTLILNAYFPDNIIFNLTNGYTGTDTCSQ